MPSPSILITSILLPASVSGFSPLPRARNNRCRSRFSGVKPPSTHALVYDVPKTSPISPFMGSSYVDAESCEQCGVNSNLHSAKDWLYNVRTLPQSVVMREIRNPVLTMAIWSTFVSVFYKVLSISGKTNLAQKMCFSSAPHSFLVSSLGMLLVFRTNSAYQRFSEGRAIWERILSVSRNFSRLLTLYEKEITPEKKYRVQKLLAAFPYLLRQHIRPKCANPNDGIKESGHGLLLHDPPVSKIETRHEGDNRFSSRQHTAPRPCWVDKRDMPWSLFGNTRELHMVAQAENRPLWACDRMAQLLASVPYGPQFTSRERLALLGSVDKLTNAIGECERIHKTAVPLNYARHSLRSLTLWLFTLPFALVKDLGLLTGPTIAVVAWLLFGVYQIGYSIEDPFQGTIRLSTLCETISRDVLGVTNVRETAFDQFEPTERMNLSAYSRSSFVDIKELLEASEPNKIKMAPEGIASNHSIESVGASDEWM